MEKRLIALILALLLASATSLRAQTLVDNYRFSTRVDPAAWIDITGIDSALVTPPGSGWITSGGLGSALTDIGFTFTFAGTDYTTFGTNLMGAVRLGARMVGTQSGNTLTAGSTHPKVDGLGVRGMVDSSCYIRCATVGTAGNHVLVVEHRLGIIDHSSTYVCWQTQLYEATGEVRLVYGPSTGTVEMPATQPGLAKSNGDLLLLNFATYAVEPYTAMPVPANAAGLWPEQWRCYSLVPDSAACPLAPVVRLLGGSADSTVLGWSGSAAAWRLRIPTLRVDTVTTGTTLLLHHLNPLTTYSGTLQAVCAAGDSSLHRRPFSFTSGCGEVCALPWTDGFQLAAGDACWQKPYTTSARSWRRVSSGNNYYMRVPSGSSTATYNEWLVSPPVVLPDTVGLTLGWWYKSSVVSGVAPQVRVRLLVCDGTDEVDTVAAWQTLCTIDHYEQYFQQYYRSLDAWAGHRVRVAFQRVGQGGGVSEVDNVGVEVCMQPSVVLEAPTLVYGGDTVAVASVLARGLLSNPVYDWYSTMEDRGLATRIADGDTLRLVYLTSGVDTVTLTLTTDYGTATATAVMVVKDCRPVTLFPWSEGFEYGLDCWETPSGYRSWTTTDNYKHGGAYCLKSNTTSSQSSLIVSQAVVVPSDAYMLRLGLWGRLVASSTSVYSNVSLLVAGADCSDWSTATELGTASINVQYRYFEFPLDAYAGQTVRFGLRYTDANRGAYVDDISIRYTREPVVSLATSAERLYGEDTVTAAATLTEGDTVGLSYQWSSAMADNGLADYIGGGAQMRIAYHDTGIDTIVVTVSNAYGSATDTAVVRICPKYDTLPYVSDFANDLPCWQVLDGTCSVHSSGYLSFEDWPTAVVMPPVWIPDDGNVVLEYECAYSFFYGSTMVMVTTDMVSFDTLSVIPFTTGTHPSTRIPLSAYAGQHIRVVFKATGQFLQYYLTHVNIRYALEPVVQAAADDGYFPGTPVSLTASLLEGDTTSLTYSWTSTLTQSGDATLTFDGGPQATLVPSVGGPDTVTVWATNNYGTDSATIVVNIKPCGVVDTLPWVEDFSNQFACWWQPEGSQWSPDNTGVMACVIKAATTGDNWLVSRAIALPDMPSDEGEGLQLWWNAAAIFANGHTYSLWITTGDYRDTGSYTQLATYSGNLPAYSSGWRTPRVDLSAYAGDTVHLAFRYQTQYYEVSGIPGILAIDSVRIFDTRPPQVAIVPPARCFVDDTVVYRANLIHGVRSGISYIWHSSMAQQGLADVFSEDTLIYVVYHAAGSDTVSLTVSNAYGNDTAWSVMTVRDCPAVTVPWYEDFEVANPCWSGSWTREQMTFMWNDSTSYVIQSNPNSWYVSPWIDLPDTVGLQLMWYKWSSNVTTNLTKIFVSPTGSIEPVDFTDTLFYRQTLQGHDSVSLDAYAGQRIRVAFASNNSSDFYALDDIRVDYNRTVQQISLAAPAMVALGDSLMATAIPGNNAIGVNYTWHSSLMDTTIVTIVPVVTIAYTVIGTDTLTVIATNPYGSDTAWTVVTVNDCNGMSVPYFEDFNSTAATNSNVLGTLPPCWETVWNGVEALAPHVILPGGYSLMSNIPDNALFMVTSNYQLYDTLAEVMLPRMADSLPSLSLAFDYRFESASFGTLTAGYYNGMGEYVVVKTMTPCVGSYRRDTVHFTTATVPDAQMVLRWSQGMAGYAVLIDNVAVFHSGTMPLEPRVTLSGPASADTYDTVTFTATLLQGDTSGLTYTWHSSLLDSTMVTLDSIAPIVYTTPGTDTLTVVAANTYGIDTATLVVAVNYVPQAGSPVVSVQGSQYATLCDSVMFQATLLEGDTAGLTFSWHSSLMDTTIVTIAPIVTMAYDATGIDTITVVAANVYGHRSASATTRVLDCEVRDTPFEATLTGGGGNIYAHFLDWQRGRIAYPRGNLSSNNGWHPEDNTWTTFLDGRNCMVSRKDDNGDATGDHWLISPPIRLPGNTTDTLAWNAYCGYTTYHVLLSPTEYVVNPDGNIDRTCFTDTLYSETGFSGWTRREADLSAYAGHTIHLAFVHTGPASAAAHASGYVAAVDTLHIWSVVNPDTVPTPPDTVWHTVTVNANVAGAAEPYGSGTYAHGDTVEIGLLYADTVTVGGHWLFLGWNDGVETSPRSIVVESDTVITALFEWVSDTTTGIAAADADVWSLWPNPASTRVCIESNESGDLTILDISGRQVLHTAVGTGTTTVDIRHLAQGVYFVRVGQAPVPRKLVVRR